MSAKRTRIGELDRRIEIQRATAASSASGMEQTTWAALYLAFAKVEYPRTGQDEGFLGDQQMATTRVNFTIRNRDGLTEKDRVLYKDQYYDIKNIIEDGGRNNYLILQAEKRI